MKAFSATAALGRSMHQPAGVMRARAAAILAGPSWRPESARDALVSMSLVSGFSWRGPAPRGCSCSRDEFGAVRPVLVTWWGDPVALELIPTQVNCYLPG